jgi:electron transfer flavoprotein beta subunit
MNIVVAIKQVEDPIIPPTYMVLDPSGKRVMSASRAPQVMNGYDANALEEAIRLKEKHGGKITAISLGDDSGRKTLKRAIGMGADSAVLLCDPAWEALDSYGIASVLAAGVHKIGQVDLVLCGRQASDSDGGQVLYWLAEMLALPVVSPIIKIEDSGADSLVVDQLIDEEFQRLKVELPALLGISSEANEPRQPTPKGNVAATRAMIPVWKASSLEVGDLAPKVTVKKLDIQIRTSNAEIIAATTGAESGTALADKLHELGLV